MVPNGWEIKRIEQIADVKGGKRIPKGYSLQLEDNGFPYIRVKDMSENGVDTSSILYVPTEIVESISKYTISANDVFITVAGALLGLVGKIPTTLENANLTENADKLTNLKINQDYLIAVLRSPIGKKLIEAEKTTNAQPKLALTRIRNFEIPVPPLPEQQKIAKILSTWDKAISTTERLIENSTQQKKALMQQLLTGKKRLLDNKGRRFEGEWEALALSNIAKVFIGLVTTMTKYYVDEGTPLIRNSDIKQNFITKQKMLSLCESFANEHENRKLRKNDVVTVHKGEVGVSAVIDDELDGCIGFATLNTRPIPEKVNSQYLSWYFNSDVFINWCVSMSTGDGRQNLNLKDFVKAKVMLPCLTEQQKIATVLTNADKEIELLEQQLADFQQEKNALMQVLLTGKKRVVVD